VIGNTARAGWRPHDRPMTQVDEIRGHTRPDRGP